DASGRRLVNGPRPTTPSSDNRGRSEPSRRDRAKSPCVVATSSSTSPSRESSKEPPRRRPLKRFF
ncbi:hypothetical protein PENANT_c303G09094, partial [Penicillium antarcticum]